MSQIHESVMAGHGYYSRHSRPQHAAASGAYPYLAAAASSVPLPSPPVPLVIGDFGCAGGANEMEPMARAIDAIRARDATVPIEVVHTDLPQNDFGPLFALLDSPDGYPAGRSGIFPQVIGRTLYGPLFPDERLQLGWSGITLHWLSSVPVVVAEHVYSNLTTGSTREQLRRQSEADWQVFLEERARELVDGGQLALVAGASAADGSSGAEALFTMINDQLIAMSADGTLRRHEYERIFYPTWNRTPSEWLEPLKVPEIAQEFELVDHRLDVSDDAETYPQYSRDHDVAAFADAYLPFVRAVTEAPFFRWLDANRDENERAKVVESFYAALHDRIEADPAGAACQWHVMSLQLRRRDRGI